MFETTIHRLRIFQCVIDSGSFNAASRKMQITQPSISAHIQALEQELGRKLFIRRPGRKPTLTEAGQFLYSYALEITSKTQQFETNLQSIQSKEKKVSVAAQRNIANNLMPHHLATFSRTHPDFEIIMYSKTQDTVIDHVMNQNADLGLIMSLTPIEGLYSEILTWHDLELVVGPTHELARKKRVDPGELEQYSFVGALKTSNHSQMINAALSTLGIQQYRMDLQVEDHTSMIEIVKRGIGIAAVPFFSIKEELKSGQLTSLPLTCEKAKIEIRLLYHPKARMSDEARLFMVYLRREMTKG